MSEGILVPQEWFDEVLCLLRDLGTYDHLVSEVESFATVRLQHPELHEPDNPRGVWCCEFHREAHYENQRDNGRTGGDDGR